METICDSQNAIQNDIEQQPNLNAVELNELEQLENAEWNEIQEEDWEFEYEPLVRPKNHVSKRRRSRIEPEPSEMEKTLEWLTMKKETRPPLILTNLTDRTGAIGSTVKLTLTLDGPGLRVDWLKDGKPIERSPTLQPSVVSGMYILTISNLEKKDEGEYTAEIHQGKKILTTSARVRVLDQLNFQEEKPFIVKIRGKDYALKKSFSVRLNCLVIEAQITGKPRPNVAWFKNDEPVQLDHRTGTDDTEGEEIYWLMIHDPVPDDSGKYRCEAQNFSGKSKIEHEVVVSKKLYFVNKSGLHHATPKLLTEEEQKAQEMKRGEFKQRAAERVAEEMQKIQETIQQEELLRLKRESTTPYSDSLSLLSARSSPAPRQKRKEEPQPYVEESIAIRFSKDYLRWDAGLTNRTVAEGSTTKLQCICSGPGSTFKWLKDGKNIKWTERVKNMSQIGIGEVVISHVTKEDAGLYKCIAVNEKGQIETSCKITILPKGAVTITSPPSFPRGIKETYSVLKDELVLEVVIRGEPKPTFIWKKDGEPIKEDRRITFIREKDDVYLLSIHHPKPEDSGRYTVLATNSEGRKEAVHTVDFTSKNEKGRPTMFGIFHKGSVVKPEDLSLEDIIRLPQPREKTPDTILPASEELKLIEPILELKKSLDLDNVTPITTHHGAINQLKFVSQLRDQTAMEGSTVKLMCYVDGPSPSFKWLKNGKPLKWNKSCKNNTRDVYGIVEISKITEQDAGQYTCKIRNEFNEISTTCTIKVYKNPALMADPSIVPPTFTRVMDHYDILTDDLVLVVQVRGVPQPELKWIRDGQVIKMNDKYFMMREPEGVYKLCIHCPTLLDAGYYTVKAKNPGGEEELKHKVEFLGKEYYEHVPLIKHADKKVSCDDDAVQVPTRKDSSTQQAPVFDDTSEVVQLKDPKRWEKTKTPPPAPVRTRCDPKRVLIFESKLRNVTAPEGTHIKLICTVAGEDAQFKWFKNGCNVNFNKVVKNTSKLGIPSLEIFGATCSHSGTYKVVADNGDCQIECECKLTIFENMEATVIPTFTRSIKEYYDIRTNDLILEIHCRGVPRPQIKFLKDCLDVTNTEYFKDGKYMISRRSEGIYELQIHAPERADSGRYICEASNKAGKNQIGYQLFVKPIAEYTHMRGIASADPKLKSKYNDDELTLIDSNRSTSKSISRMSSVQPKSVGEDETIVVTDAETLKDEVKCEDQIVEITPEEQERIEILAKTPQEQLDIPFTLEKFTIKFVMILKNQMVVEGSSVKFICSVDGYRPDFKWFKDHQPLVFGKQVKNLSQDTIGSIQIMSCRPSDAGLYRCIAYNKYGQIGIYAKLKVIAKGNDDLGAPPQFSRIRDFYDLPTNQIIIEARILGTVPMKIFWFKDCRDIKNDDKYLMGREPGGVYKLYISKPVHRDSGTYMIKAENSYGTEQIKHEVNFWDREEYLHVHGIAHADPKGKRRQIETVQVEKKMQATFPVQEADEEIHAQHRPRPFDAPTAEMQLKEAKMKEHLAKPRILQRNPIEFITKLHNQLLPKGSIIRLTCCVSDNNRIEAEWFKNGEPVEYGRRIKAALNEDAAICNLEIQNATLDDSGVYRCEIKTKKNSISDECTVKIFALDDATPEAVPPTFITAIKDYYRPVTNDIVIECKIRGHPRPKIRWQRDGQFVNHCDKYEPYHMEDGTVMLVVNNPKMIDSGRYVIVAENSVKKVEMSHEVRFEGKAEEPKKKKKMESVVLENEIHPRVYPKPKDLSPIEIPVEENKEEYSEDEKLKSEYDMNITVDQKDTEDDE